MGSKETALEYLDAHEQHLGEIAQDIWDHPEVALHESTAADRLSAELEGAGFSITRGIGGMPTAFTATWGEGRPVIGLLGEYDALPGISQKVSAAQEPVVAGGAGHGCGHNLLGAGSLAAALAVKEAMVRNSLPGTLAFYGCPAEETLTGKVFMARDGAFSDLDATLTWHPAYTNSVWSGSSLALNSFKVDFHGVAAHAAVMPHMGRSALDGAQLMDVGVNYLREHVVQEARFHSVITHGGDAPNVVPPYAQIWYYVRAPHREQVEGIYARMLDIAKGAALMSGTSYDIDLLAGCYEFTPNRAINDRMMENMRALGGPRFTEEERAFAEELQGTVPPQLLRMGMGMVLQMSGSGVTPGDLGGTLCEAILPPSDTFVLPGSTDLGDVSQIAPTGHLFTSCWPLGAPNHSWQAVAASGSSTGKRGMIYAARVLALTALDLLFEPQIVQAAHKEFERATGGKLYEPPLPEGTQPH